MANEIVASMSNLAESGQDAFVRDWTEYAKIDLYEQGISKRFLNSVDADYVLGRAVTDLIEDGDHSSGTQRLIATLRVNHPHSEDSENV